MASNTKKAKISSLSNRSFRFNDQDNPLLEYFNSWIRNKYDKTTNPEGIINLGISQNNAVDDIIVPKLNECFKFEYTHSHYSAFEGVLSFRESIAKLLERHMRPVEKIKPEHIVVLNGGSSLLSVLGSVLCDPGEGIIIPAPYYSGFDTELTTKQEIVCIPALVRGKITPDGGFDSFRLTSDILEKALSKAKEQNVVVRALLISNPQNPLGVVYTEEEVRLCMKFCQKHSLHLISDEFYILSIFKKDRRMTPALSISGLMDPNYMHIVWAFSKDFALSGIRCGALYTRNLDVLAAASFLSGSHSTPFVIQSALEKLINDQDWVENVFIPTNHQRLRECHDIVTTTLKDIGVSYVDGGSGFYIWSDFTQFLETPTVDAERKFQTLLQDHGVYICGGTIFHYDEPGWFRLIFPMEKETLELAMTRLRKAVGSSKQAE